MKITRLIGALAVAVGLAAGAFLAPGTTMAAGDGPTITASGGGPKIVGSSFNIQFAATTNAVDAWSGYNLSVVYDQSQVTINSVTDQSVGAGLFGSTFCPPAVLITDFGGALIAPLKGFVLGCTSLSAPTSTTSTGNMAVANITANAVGVTALHMVSAGPPDNGGGSFGTYTINAADNTIQNNVLACGDGGQFVLMMGFCGPLPVPGSGPQDVVLVITDPPPDLSLTKTGLNSIVAGQPYSFTININNPSPTTAATNVNVTDNVPAAFVITSLSGPDAASCSFLGQAVTCGPTSIPAGGSFQVVINTTVDSNAGGTSPQNCATVTLAEADPNTANNTGCKTVQIIAPAVAWEKDPQMGQVFITNGNQTFTFNEVMVNQGDPNGLGGFEFTILYDNTIFHPPVVDLTPAINLFAAAGRVLDCSITVQLETRVHVACASTGPLGTGPQWVGPQVMATVTLTPRITVVQALKPTKENGIVTWVKDTHVEAANTCGQPLNDGSAPFLPGEGNRCQGELLQGILPGGQVENSDAEVVITLRRLEADVTKDCLVDILDMQAIASRYGYALGSLLYNSWYDLEPHTFNGDGDIDIKDIQFVFGRFGSTCLVPIPAQVPQPLP